MRITFSRRPKLLTTPSAICFFFAIALPLTTGTASGDDGDLNHGVVFTYPIPDQIYNMWDTLNVTYTSPFPTPNLYLWCNGGGRQVSVQAVPGYNATVPIELNFTSATPCWFNLRPGTIAGFGENTPSFNIIGQERDSGRRVFGPPLASTTSALPSTTPTPRSSASTTEAATSGYDRAWELGASSTTNPDTSATTAANSASTATSTPDTNGSGLSVTVAAGIGAGVAFGVLAIAGGVFAWLWRARRRRRAQDEHFHYKNDQLRSTSGREKEVIVGGTQVVLANSGRGKQDQYLGFEQRAFELSSAHMPAEIASSQSQYAEREIPRGMPLSPTDDGR